MKPPVLSPSLIAALAALAALAHALLYADVLIDDAFISFRYAANLADGHGLVFNPGERVEGYTNFLWVLFAAAFERAGLGAPGPMQALGGATAAAFAASCAGWAAHLSPRRGSLAASIAGVGSAMWVGVGFFGACGLETVAFALCWLWGTMAVFTERRALFVCATVLAFLLRPEAAVLGVVGTLAFAWRRSRQASWPAGVREGATLASAFLLLLAPYLAFKLWWFGALLPNTFHAKTPDVVAGVEYALRQGWAWAAVLALAGALARSSAERARVAAAAAPLALIALEGGDWMPGARMVTHFVGPMAVVAGVCLAEATHREPRAPVGRRRLLVERALALCAIAGLLGVSGYKTKKLRRNITPYVGVQEAMQVLGERLNERDVRSLGLFDIGRIGYVMRDTVITDHGGLTDLTIAATEGSTYDHVIPIDYYAERAPEVVLIGSRQPPDEAGAFEHVYPVEAALTQSEWFAAHYTWTEVVYANRAFYWNVYVRRLEASAPRDSPSP